MKNRVNKKIGALFVAVVLFAVSFDLRAQAVTGQRLALTVRDAASVGLWRDWGVSPRVYQFAAIAQGVSMSGSVKQWTIFGDVDISGGLLSPKLVPVKKFSLTGYYGIVDVRVGTLRQVWQSTSGNWSIHVGASLSNYLFASYVSRFQNASSALTDLFQPELHFTAEYNLPNSNPLIVLPGWFTAYGTVSIAPFGLAYRPGFAYIDNYTSGREASDYVFSSYRASVAWLPRVQTELGVRFNLRSGNRIGLAWRWDCRASHGTALWDYEQATQSIVLNFVILLKKN